MGKDAVPVDLDVCQPVAVNRAKMQRLGVPLRQKTGKPNVPLYGLAGYLGDLVQHAQFMLHGLLHHRGRLLPFGAQQHIKVFIAQDIVQQVFAPVVAPLIQRRHKRRIGIHRFFRAIPYRLEHGRKFLEYFVVPNAAEYHQRMNFLYHVLPVHGPSPFQAAPKNAPINREAPPSLVRAAAWPAP